MSTKRSFRDLLKFGHKNSHDGSSRKLFGGGNMLDESTREDTVIEFSSSSSSLYSSSNILIAPRSDDFNERTWWMVDIEMNCKTTTNQGATPLVKRCMRVYNWDIEKARKVLLAYQQFLSLKNQYKDWDSTIYHPIYWLMKCGANMY